MKRGQRSQRQRCRSRNIGVVRAQHRGKSELRSDSFRGDVVLLVLRVRQTQTNLLGGNCAVLKKTRDLRADLAHSSVCNLISALGEDGRKQTLFSRQQPWQNTLYSAWKRARPTHTCSHTARRWLEPGESIWNWIKVSVTWGILKATLTSATSLRNN